MFPNKSLGFVIALLSERVIMETLLHEGLVDLNRSEKDASPTSLGRARCREMSTHGL